MTKSKLTLPDTITTKTELVGWIDELMQRYMQGGTNGRRHIETSIKDFESVTRTLAAEWRQEFGG